MAAEVQMREFYHFSLREPWPEIRRSGVLEARWTGHSRPGVPATVHLSDSPDPDSLPYGLRGLRPVRFTLRLPAGAVHYWPTWGWANVERGSWRSVGVPEDDNPDGPLNQWNLTAGHWYVTEEPVPNSAWTVVEDLESGEVLWPDQVRCENPQ